MVTETLTPSERATVVHSFSFVKKNTKWRSKAADCKHPPVAFTVAVCQAHSLVENVIRRHVALEGDKMAAAPGGQQAHVAVQDRLDGVGVGCQPTGGQEGESN